MALETLPRLGSIRQGQCNQGKKIRPKAKLVPTAEIDCFKKN
jgi:hypothetical protein